MTGSYQVSNLRTNGLGEGVRRPGGSWWRITTSLGYFFRFWALAYFLKSMNPPPPASSITRDTSWMVLSIEVASMAVSNQSDFFLWTKSSLSQSELKPSWVDKLIPSQMIRCWQVWTIQVLLQITITGSRDSIIQIQLHLKKSLLAKGYYSLIV